MMLTTAANTYIEVSPLMVTHAVHMGPTPEGERCALYLSNREHPIYLKENAARVMRTVEQEQARLLGAVKWGYMQYPSAPEPPRARTITKGM